MGVVWFPEPPNEPEVDFSSSATGVVAPAGSSSDSDEDATDGLDLHYVLVPDGEESDDDVDDDAQSQASSSGSPPPDESTQERCGVAEETVSSLWSGPASDIALGEEKEAQVRAAMQGFTLPPSALPPWAAYVPEELWHSEIRRRLPTNQHLT